MIYSLQFTDESLNSDPQCFEWIERVNSLLRDKQAEFATNLAAFGTEQLSLHAESGRTFELEPR